VEEDRRKIAIGLWVFVAIVIVVIGLLLWKFVLTRPQPQPTPVPTPLPAPLPPLTNKIDPAIVPKAEPKKPVEPPKPIPKADLPIDDGSKIALCPGKSAEKVALSADGTMLGHLPYANANPADLASPPASFTSGNCSQMQGEAKIALEAMIEAARASDPAIGDAMVGLSCFRSIAYQKEVFCRKVGDGLAARARASAPPGYSEHATGYVMDFGDRNNPHCNLQTCFATTPVGMWLAENGSAYGFVLSFPKGNSQGVMYEPWHWRYEGSGAAKAVFANAR
jgi:zinc D-Ala-D-Ala carboxypeptidase